MNDIVTIARDNASFIALVAVVGMSIIEVAPIKINPWSWIGRVVNKSILDKMDKLEADVAEVERKVGESTAIASRYRILRFDDEILHNIMHSKEHFDQILVDIDVYEKFCEEHPTFKNNMAVMAISHIKEVYKKCSKENSFL